MKQLSLDHIRKMQEGRRKARGSSHKTILDSKQVGQASNPAIRARLSEMPVSCRKRYLSAMTGKRPLGAIHAFCRECMGWEGLPDSVRSCTAPACPLYPYRPYRD